MQTNRQERQRALPWQNCKSANYILHTLLLFIVKPIKLCPRITSTEWFLFHRPKTKQSERGRERAAA